MQVGTLVEMAAAAVRREGRAIPEDAQVACNVSLGDGNICVSINTASVTQGVYFVTFNAAGRILDVAGATGFHGEGGWRWKSGK